MMKGILKIYHPDETLKYFIKSSYCKAVYLNKQNFLEVELITDDNLDHVDDDSLQYRFPQICLKVSDFPIEDGELEGKNVTINDEDDEVYTEVDLYDDEEAFLFENSLNFSKNNEGELELYWKGKINDFYTDLENPVPFKLKCNFKEDAIEVDD